MTQPGADLYLELQDRLAILSFSRPDSRVNLLSRDAMLRLDELLGSIEESVSRREVFAVLIRSDKPDNFIAGADINELADLESASIATEISRRGQQIFQKLERLAVPTIAAIHGTCVGGGLELALACDHRVASDHPKTRLGLPETQLGILPGLGGTVRLPRLIGLAAALDLILSGRQVQAGRALALGLVDRVVGHDGFEAATLDLALSFARGERPLLPHSRSALARFIQDGPAARWLLRRLSRKQVLARTKGHYPAPLAALDVTIDGLALDAAQAQQREAEAFGELAVTQVCKNLIGIFKLNEGARKQVPAGEARQISHAGVVGAGLMGAGIAELLAYQEIKTAVVDIDDERVEAGLVRARELLTKAAKRSAWTESDLQRRIDCLRGSTGYDDFETIELVVEAVVEKMEIKRKILTTLEQRLHPDAVIASNTSALSISELQANLDHPRRVCGLHFFNPPHRMPLVEVVRGAQTSGDTLATAFQLALRLGKTPVVVKDSPGFVVNRILAAYLTEAGHVIQQGMPVESLDRAMTRFGMPMGPLRLLDEIGLDVVAEVSATMREGFGERFDPAPIMAEVLATGVKGRAQGRGFYNYADSKPKGVNSDVQKVLRENASGEPPSADAAEERLVLAMINEAVRALDDRVVASVEALDLAMIMGTGFPPFRGGLLRYADTLGLPQLVSRLRELREQLGSRFAPAAGLSERPAFFPS